MEQPVTIFDSIVLLPPPPRPANPCAWCLAEQGIEPGNDSHGICVRHREMILARWRERKQQRRASQYIADYCANKQDREVRA